MYKMYKEKLMSMFTFFTIQKQISLKVLIANEIQTK